MPLPLTWMRQLLEARLQEAYERGRLEGMTEAVGCPERQR